MKKLTPWLLLILVAGLTACVNAQEEHSKATLMGSVLTVRSDCEARMTILDRYIARLNEEPAAQGYVIIYKRLGSEWMAKSREKEIRNYLTAHNIDTSRVTITVGGVRGGATIEYWIVPPGADNPTLKEWDDGVSGPPPSLIKEPRNFSEEYPDDCETGELYLEGYAEELDFVGPYPGRIIVQAKSPAAFQKRRNEITTELAKYGIAAKRLTFLYKPNKQEESVELWILPLKKGMKSNLDLPGM